MLNDNLEVFFKNRDLVIVVDAIAKRYGLSPYQVLEMSLYEFCFNSAVLVVANLEEADARKKEKLNIQEGTSQNFNKLGIGRKIIKKEKK